MTTIVDITVPLLARCARKLKAEDLCSFRLSCKRFYNISLSKLISQDLVFNMATVSDDDLRHAFVFLDKINKGKFIHLVMTLPVGENYEAYRRSWSKDKVEQILSHANNLNSFQGDISLTEFVSAHCPDLKSLTLVSCRQPNPDINLNDDFSKLRSLKQCTFLEELNIWRIRNLPISVLDLIVENMHNLSKLEFVSVDFTWDDKAVVESRSLEGMRTNAVSIKTETVVHWVFQDVDTEGLKIVLPDSTETLVKHNSPDIWWKSSKVKMKTMSSTIDRSEFFFPPYVEHMTLHAVLTNWTITDLCNQRHINDYKSFTLYSSVTAEVIDKLEDKVRKVGGYSLTKMHLSHCRKKQASDCTDEDIAKLFTFFKKVQILVIENFDKISSDLIEQLYNLNLNLRVLRLVNCRNFRSQDVTCIMSYKYATFKVEVINDGKCEQKGSAEPPPLTLPSLEGRAIS